MANHLITSLQCESGSGNCENSESLTFVCTMLWRIVFDIMPKYTFSNWFFGNILVYSAYFITKSKQHNCACLAGAAPAAVLDQRTSPDTPSGGGGEFPARAGRPAKLRLRCKWDARADGHFVCATSGARMCALNFLRVLSFCWWRRCAAHLWHTAGFSRLLFQHVTHLQWICVCAVWNANAGPHITHTHGRARARTRAHLCG